MKHGLQTHFNAPVGQARLLEVAALGYTVARIDAQDATDAALQEMLAETQAAGLAPLVIVWRPEMLALLPAGCMAEFGNERDPGGVAGLVPPVEYRARLELACTAARAAGVQLWAPGLSNLDENSLAWLNAVRDAGGGWPTGLHGISAHRYGPSSDVLQPHRGFSSREREVAWLQAACAGLPYCITEFGWSSFGELTELEAADHVGHEWRFWAEQGAALAVQFQLNDGLGEGERYGIRATDGRWKATALTVPLPLAQTPQGAPPEPEPLPGLRRSLVVLWAHTGRPVTFEHGGGVDSRASQAPAVVADRPYETAEQCGSWEQLEEVALGGGQVALRCGPYYLTAEDGGGGAVSTSRTQLGAWERWTAEGGGYRAESGHWLCCEPDGTVNCTRIARSVYETFARTVLSGGEPRRDGLVRAVGKCAQDDTGPLHPLGITFFWALYGWRHERERVLAHLDWLATFDLDFVRILGEVDWSGRGIDPHWPDYEQVLGEFMDAAWARNMRTQVTLIGGKQGDALAPVVADKVARVVNAGRQHQLVAAEIVNEWDRLNKMTMSGMESAARQLRAALPHHLIGLSRPIPKKGEHDETGFGAMFAAMQRSGANLFLQHPRRSTADRGWSHVRQGYDFHKTNHVAWNNEPEGPQSSVVSESRPLLLAMARVLTVMCGGAGYVFHPGHMVTGRAEPDYGRPHDLMDVPGIIDCLDAVRGVDALLPEDVENWRVVNNGRDDHPLPLDGKIGQGFWEGSSAGSVNKNYAAVRGGEFVVALAGVQSKGDEGQVHIGTALRTCDVVALDPVTGREMAEKQLSAGEPWSLPGRKDTQVGYVVRGTFI